ncbi:3-hydroxyacyl-ACP dehydratase FabZ [Clostridium bowmanii]|uniref:3-hydroxyacyl-ACP dehydratase FabZ n=1 Tax=Clostridium bowmanii TaxID=132925 RepID=UPI001C0D9270|nr:3-hydroxyacyl-ACP dehydratase FabZ [Clostridium bowmanii]MBU3190118.1 3-hydroxyacyl-ACP dehydratase FabZ [Clostridium bowmanii]MCA1074713.1 3-hydroxyacyl-ACP dehydratase FabZ [Clostridium bowmanii]
MEDIKGTTLNIKQIQEIIPHRYPFLFVDKIEELEPGKRAVGYKNITMNEYFFQGHFPEEPILPGVIIIEALAQVGAVALLSMEDYKGKIAYFGGINKARFRKKVVPGDVLRLEVEIIKMKGPVGIGKAVATVNGAKVAEAEITFAVGIE